MYDRILVPFDGSDGATTVLHHVGELAHWAGATVQLLYVADTTRDSVTVVEGQTVDALVREGEQVVSEGVETLESLGVSVETDVVQGNPASTIVEYADRYDQELIVMPTHGREGLSRYLLGSVSEKVVRLSGVPVLTVRMQPDETLAFPYENVLVATDGSPAATRAADHLVTFAAALDATVHAVSVVDDGSLGPDVRSTGSGAGERAANEAVDSVVETAQERGVPAVRHVKRGAPVEAILDCIADNAIHVAGLGTTGRRGTDRILLGSVAEKTVRSAPVPVVTVGDSD